MNYYQINKNFTKRNIFKLLSSEEFNLDLFNKKVEEDYLILSKNYRSEFFYKNTLFNKLIVGKYGLVTTSAISELMIKASKADFVILNRNRGIVYEIKTDLDNLDRLVYQLIDYSHAFSELYVVTSEKNYYPVYKVIRESIPSVGIIILTDKISLSIRKHAEHYDENLDHETLFKLLRKKEYELLLYNKYRKLPDVTPVKYFKECLMWFKKIDLVEAQSLVFNQLKNRNLFKDINLLKKLPISTRWLIYSGNFDFEILSKIHK